MRNGPMPNAWGRLDLLSIELASIMLRCPGFKPCLDVDGHIGHQVQLIRLCWS